MVPSDRTPKASATASIALRGADWLPEDGSTLAVARARIWRWPCRPRTMMKGSIPEPAVRPPPCSPQSIRQAAPTGAFASRMGEAIEFEDGHFGPQRFVAGQDFGDFLVWRRDDLPSYQLAVVVDDAAMRITEVVRGADLLKSTARQILLARALGVPSPAWYHCDLLLDEQGQRLAKRHDALSLRRLREQGETTAGAVAADTLAHNSVILQSLLRSAAGAEFI